MKTASSTPSCTSTQNADVSTRSIVWEKLADYLELTKPRILVLALLCVAVGFALGSTDGWHTVRFLHAAFGITLVAAGSSALNQLIERRIDARMRRTANRPLPAGRMLPRDAFWFGTTAGCVGSWYLAVNVNLLTASLAVAVLLLYTLVYTPLKRVTSLCTAGGAVAGALPPVLGWTAASGQLEAGALLLFAILFLWQFPHFLAIAWIYRDEYQRAGLKMLPALSTKYLSTEEDEHSESAARLPELVDVEKHPPKRKRIGVTGLMSVTYALALIPVSLLPSRFAVAGDAYFLAAVVLGLGYLLCAVRFLLHESDRSARGLLISSLIYLPLLLLSLTWDHTQLLR